MHVIPDCDMPTPRVQVCTCWPPQMTSKCVHLSSLSSCTLHVPVKLGRLNSSAKLLVSATV